MQTKNVANLPVSRSSTLLRMGPHEDLTDCCEFEIEIDDDLDPASAVTLRDFIKAALVAESVDERVIAAKKAVEKSDGECGIAWLVLAREGTDNPDEAERFSQKAVQQLRQELESPPCHFDEAAYAFAIADLAQLTWNAGKHMEAIELLTLCLQEHRDNLWSDAQVVLRDLAVSFLIQRGESNEAQRLLHSYTEDDAPWHYLNALTHFCIVGDTLVSRSALARAFTKGTMTADRLLNGKASPLAQTIDAFGLTRFIDDTESAWHATSGALTWLREIYGDPFGRHNRDMVEISVPAGDKQRWKRWEDTFERADYYLMQDDDKQARKSYRTALREAEQIDYSFAPFYDTMTAMLDLAEHTSESFGELRSRIESRARRFDYDPAAIEPMHGLHFQSFGTLFQFMDDYETAAVYHKKALSLVDRHLTNCRSLTLVDAEEAMSDLAFSFFELQQYSESIPLLMRDVELLESYLGPKHVRLLETLEMAYKCFCHVGDAEGARLARERITSIDELYFAGSSKPQPSKCDSCGLEHD